MKFFAAVFAHETSSFSPIPTSRRSFEVSGTYRRPGPDADLKTLEEQGRGSAYGEWIRLARERGHNIALGTMTSTGPSGRTVKADYESLRDEILSDLKAAMPVDAVLLMLHGAQMAVGYDDCEGDLISRVRQIVGKHAPIGAELDLHCNISRTMLDSATVIMACKEYPHTDFADRAVDLFALIEGAGLGRIKPVMSFERVPMLNLFFTTREPMRSFVDRTTAMEGKDKILSVTLCHGFSSADIADASASVIVVTDNDPERGAKLASQLGHEFYGMKVTAGPQTLSVAASLDEAMAASPGKPVVIADGSDNPGAGAAGDSTFILKAMLERGVRNAALAMIWDPVAVQLASDAGVGAKLEMRIGGKVGPMSGEPLDVEAEVIGLAENPMQIAFSGQKDSPIGRSAAIRVKGIDIVLNSRRTQTFSPECLSELGIDPHGKKILVVKSNQHFYARFAPIAQRVIYCDAPGTSSNDLRRRPYRNLKRPIWPLDDVTY